MSSAYPVDIKWFTLLYSEIHVDIIQEVLSWDCSMN